MAKRFYVTRVSNFHYPCHHCGKKYDSVFLAELCFQEDMKQLETPERHLIPLKDYIKNGNKATSHNGRK
jgi:hypothetical protein